MRSSHNRVVVTFILLLGSFVTTALANPFETLPTYHWAYRIIDELQVRGYFETLFLSYKPYTRGDIARYLERLDQQIEAGRRTPNRYETNLLDQLREEFKEERAMLRQETDGGQVKLGGVGQSDLVDKGVGFDLAIRSSIRNKISLNLNSGVGIYNSILLDQNLKDRPNYLGRIFLSAGGYAEQAYLRAEFKRFRFELGRDFLVLGAGHNGTLLLSDASRPFDLYTITFATSFLQFSAFGMVLDDCPYRMTTAPDGSTVIVCEPATTEQVRILPVAKRFLNGHRLDLNLFGRIHLGISEVALYGGPNRNFELAYLNPLNFYHGEQLNDEKIDRTANVLGTVDLRIFPYRGIELFGELLIDDIQLQRSTIQDLEPNQFGLIAGAQWADPLQLSGLTLRTEYSRVANRTYNVLLFPWEKYLHRRDPIGHPLGNNFDRFVLSGTAWVHRDVRLDLGYTLIRQGEDNIEDLYNTDFLKVPSFGAGYDEPFPFGTVQKTQTVDVELLYKPSIDFRLSAAVRFGGVDNFGFVPGRRETGIQFFRIGAFFN